MGSEQRANHNLRASKRMQRASMGSEQQGNHNFHALKRTRMSHIQQMHDDEDDENARNNDDPAFINEGTSINVIPQIGMPFNGGVMRARCRDYSADFRLTQSICPNSSPLSSTPRFGIGADDTGDIRGRDIKIETREGQLLNVSDCAGYYDPLQYPLLLPYGTYGWDINSRSSNGRPMTCRAYYAYVLQIRLNEDSVLLRGGRLLQQYAVDNYVKIETQKLRYIRNNQPDLRCEFYNGLHDSLNAGEDNAGNIGRRIILPSTFIGSPRDMHQRYQDAMALVQKYGKPDIFLTMTCNPNWDEIKAELLPGQTSQDRPDLCTRIFRAKLENLKEEVIKKGVLGKIIVYVYVIEFQKRGLPHAHMLLMLHDDDKLNNPDDYDKIVRAELPDQDQEPQLYDVVLRHMIHGPCGTYKPNSPCMKGGNCKRGYPKPFSMNTFQGNDSYPNYRRRDIHSNANVDNRWVISYNPWLLARYDCHINVEICCSIKSVKYLYKYVYKGPDRVTFTVQPESNEDEIKNFVDARWVCAP
uniref:uncharacterized protein LOC101307898 n=1 Tax=Fragaria vesca subsp. vesca TaxID=101020 RepID=UPI0005C80AA6|nr:PREDICTED: uncharacterized protein LOC101307898 [Fragaria vesca subsp. vesca]